MFAEETAASPDIFQILLQLLQSLVMPDWNDLIRGSGWIPILLLLLLVVSFAVMAWLWLRAGRRNNARLIPRTAGSPPPGIHMPGPSIWPFVAPIAVAFILFGLVLGPRGLVWLIPLGLVVGLIAMVGWLRDAMKEWRREAMLSEGAAGGHAIAAHVNAAVDASALELSPGYAGGMSGVPAQRALVPVETEYREPPPGVHMPGPSAWPFFAPIALMVIFYGVIFSPILLIGGVILGMISAAGWLRDASREWRSTEAVGHAVPTTRDPRVAWPRRVLPAFALVVAVCLVIVLIPAFGNFIGSFRPAEPGATAVAVPAKPEISASTPASFETKNLIVPAGRAFELVFHNKNDGIQHNVEIANGPDRTTVYLDGEVITGINDITYQVGALEVGTYYFLCKIHPNMNGTVEAVQESGQGGQPQGPPVPGGGSPAAPGGGSPAAP